MKKLNNFASFNSLNEEQKLSNLDLYRPVALGVAEAFSIYGYFISLLEEKIDQADWDKLIASITSIKNYEGKWRQILGLSKKLQGVLQSFSSQKNKGLGNWIMKIDDIGQETVGITQALERFKTASDLLIEGLPEERIQNRLKMIDKSLSEINPYILKESFVFEKEGQFAPSEYSILMTADRLASQVVNMRLTLRYLAQTLPQIKSSADQTEANVLDPLAEQIKKFLDSGIMPKETLPVSKSVEKAYADKGWIIKNQVDKYMVDAFEQLSKIESQIIDVYKRIEGYKNQAVDKYQAKNDASEFIDSGNNILKGIKDRIIKRMQMQRLEKKSGEMIVGSTTNQLKRAAQQDILFNTDQLKDYLKRKYQSGN
jgi:hypothetical protein